MKYASMIMILPALLMSSLVLFSASEAVSGQCCYPEMDLSGTWKSMQAEDLMNGFFSVREYRFTAKECVLSHTHYSDREMKNPVFTFIAEGSYTVNEESRKVRGANNTAFRFGRKVLTLRTADKGVIEHLGFGGCGLRKDVAADITAKGCSHFRSVQDYPVEYDVVKRDGNILYFGKRPADGNMDTDDKRPVALGLPLMKSE